MICLGPVRQQLDVRQFYPTIDIELDLFSLSKRSLSPLNTALLFYFIPA